MHWINAQLQAPVDMIEVDQNAGRTAKPARLPIWLRDLDAGAVDQLVMIGVNPGYDAPADLEFAKRSAKAAFRLHLGRYADETADLADLAHAADA